MKRLLLTAALAALGWYAGIMIGTAIGGLVAWFASALAGKVIGGGLAGLLGGLASADKGTRRAVAFTTAASTSIACVFLLDVQNAPVLVGAAFGAILGATHAIATNATRHDTLSRATISSLAWSFGFALQEHGGRFAKLGLLAPSFVVFALAFLALARVRRAAPAVV